MKRMELVASVYFAALTLGLTASATESKTEPQKKDAKSGPAPAFYCSVVGAGALDAYTLNKAFNDVNELRDQGQLEKAKLTQVLDKLNIKEKDLLNPLKRKEVMAKLNNGAARIKIIDSKLTELENKANAATQKIHLPFSKPVNEGSPVKARTMFGFQKSEYLELLEEKKDLNRFLIRIGKPDTKTGRAAFAIRTKEQRLETYNKLLSQSAFAESLLKDSKLPAARTLNPTFGQRMANASKVLVKEPFSDLKLTLKRTPNSGPAVARTASRFGGAALNAWAVLELGNQIKGYCTKDIKKIDPQVGTPIVVQTQVVPAKPADPTNPASKPVAATLEVTSVKPLKDAIKVVESSEVEATPAHVAPAPASASAPAPASVSDHVSTANGTLAVEAAPGKTQQEARNDFFSADSVDTSKDTNLLNPAGLTN